jgi:hypothetical protein
MSKKKSAFMPDMYVQIDVMQIKDNYVLCNLYTGVLCAQIAISKNDYHYLVEKGFFIRDGKEKDSAQVINTTEVYYKE